MDIEGFTAWLMEKERAQSTIDSYVQAVKDFFRAYPDLTKQNLISYKAKLLKYKKPATVGLRITGINIYLEYLGKAEISVKQIKRPKSFSAENVITLEEYKHLVEGLKKDGDWRGYWLIKYLAKTGARVSEFVRLDKTCLQKGYAEMWTKGKIRRILIPHALIEESKDYFETVKGDLLFPTLVKGRTGKPLTTKGVDMVLKRYADRYGVRREAMHPHSFRHLFAIEFLKRDKDVTLLADLMGHSDISTTARYTRLSQAEQASHLERAMSWKEDGNENM